MAKFSDMIQSEQPVLIDFSAVWCGPCKAMSPILQEVKSKVGNKVVIYKIDIDKNPGLAQEYRIQGVPTLVLFKQGKEVWRMSGVMPAFKLVTVLQGFY
ncbi:thioredoxin-like protein slr0233 [Filimonas sp.]|nr:thioredoxin-like protein slr0233 [Filimonas sp.]